MQRRYLLSGSERLQIGQCSLIQGRLWAEESQRSAMADPEALEEASKALSFAEFLERMKEPAAADLVRSIKRRGLCICAAVQAQCCWQG